MSQAHAAAAVGGGKVVILGGQGFIGRSVARAILSASPTVRVQLASRRINPKSPPLLTTKQSDLASFLPPTSPPSLLSRVLPPCHADITDPASLAKACADATGIVNLVGIMHEQHPKYTFDSVHEHGPRSVAKVAKEVGARLVHVSAIGADPESDIPYARSKGRGEDAVRSVLRDEVTIIRPSIVFGPDDDFFNRFAKLATILPVVPVFGGGETRFQPVYVEDLAKGIAASVLSPKPIGKTIEAGGPNVYTYADMMKLMLQQANMWRPVVSVPWFVGNVQGMVFEKLPLNLFTLTRDQVRLLKFDNVVGEGAETLEALGVHLTPAEEVLHTYLRKPMLGHLIPREEEPSATSTIAAAPPKPTHSTEHVNLVDGTNPALPPSGIAGVGNTPRTSTSIKPSLNNPNRPQTRSFASVAGRDSTPSSDPTTEGLSTDSVTHGTARQNPLVIHTLAEYRTLRTQWARQGLTVGFVPTMGALHSGHINLTHRAASECDVVVTSIFVNPAQFAPTEDLAKYPRTLPTDLELLGEAATTDVVFAPTVDEMYPAGITLDVTQQQGTFVTVLGLSHQMEGAIRPHFFRGVATVVTKLFNAVQPTHAYFGQKDAQQCAVVKTMVRDLLVPLKIVVVPTVRESDGLAMSSRNRYLSTAERAKAPLLYKALLAAQGVYETQRERGVSREEVIGAAKKVIEDALAEKEKGAPKVVLEYLSLADPYSLREVDWIEPAAAAASESSSPAAKAEAGTDGQHPVVTPAPASVTDTTATAQQNGTSSKSKTKSAEGTARKVEATKEEVTSSSAILSGAVKIGNTRIIDNLLLGVDVGGWV